jgi:hypothetical protein
MSKSGNILLLSKYQTYNKKVRKQPTAQKKTAIVFLMVSLDNRRDTYDSSHSVGNPNRQPVAESFDSVCTESSSHHEITRGY